MRRYLALSSIPTMFRAEELLDLTQCAFPELFDDTEYWRSIEGAPYFHWVNPALRGKISAATYWNLMEIYNREMMALCQSEKVECFDLAAVVPHSSDYMYDVCHFTELGCALVTRELAQFLRRSGEIQSRQH